MSDEKKLQAPKWLDRIRKVLPFGRLLDVTEKQGQEVVKWGYNVKDLGAQEGYFNAKGQLVESVPQAGEKSFPVVLASIKEIKSKNELNTPKWLNDICKNLPFGRSLGTCLLNVNGKTETVVKWGYYTQSGGTIVDYVNSKAQIIRKG